MIRSIRIQIRTVRKGFKAFKSKFYILKGIWNILIEILTIRKGFEAFEWIFEPFERYSKHSNSNSIHSKGIRSIRIQIWTIWKWFEAFESIFYSFEALESILNTSNEISLIWMQIWTIWNVSEGLGLGPWLVPCETTQKRLFLPKNDLKITILVVAVTKTFQNL